MASANIPPNPTKRRRRIQRIGITVLLDVLLLPVALGVVLLEDVLWDVAQRLLRGLSRLQLLRAAQAGLGRWPAVAVLPLFLVPEVVSHLAGFLGAYLLARGQIWVAVLLLVVIKGIVTLVVVWIYRAASATLLGVGWFARLHGATLFVRSWSLAQVAPLRDALRVRLATSPRIVGRRFRSLRARVLAAFRNLRMIF